MDQWLIIALFAAAVAIYAMVDILMAKISYRKKAAWFAVIALIPIIGPLVYLFKKRSIVNAR